MGEGSHRAGARNRSVASVTKAIFFHDRRDVYRLAIKINIVAESHAYHYIGMGFGTDL